MKKILAVTLLVATLATLFCFSTIAADDDAKAYSVPMQALVDSSDVYKDISVDAWYKSAVDGVVSFGLIDGTSEKTFSPNVTADRATLVTALYRMTGTPKVSKEVPFVDLTEDWYRPAVAWAYETGVINGTSETTFSPSEKITREQLVTIFFRYMNYMGGNTKSASDLTVYPDVKKVSAYATDAFSWACAEGLVTGNKGNDGVVRLDPQGGATRAQMSAIVMRFCERYQSIFEMVDNPSEDDKYKLFDNSMLISHRQSSFGVKDSDHVLILEHPKQWGFSKVNGAYIIIEDGTKIGRLYPGNAPDLDEWKIVSSQTLEKEDISVYEYIEKYGSGVTLRFRYRYSFEYIDNNGKTSYYTLILDYTKLAASSERRIFKFTKIQDLTVDPGYGKLSHLKDKSVYFVGNSFIGYSEIPYILEEMAYRNGKQLKVDHIWLPNTRMYDFARNSEILATIKSGKYDAIFICGMYGSDDAIHCDKIKEVCKAAGVELILFPAHNESAAVVTATKARHSDLEIIEWKNEIESLISDNRNFWDFCYNDGPKHSNEIAGYVGAHMIYRAIYGKNPTAPVSQYVKQADVNRILGDYIKNPYILKKPTSTIRYFD